MAGMLKKILRAAVAQPWDYTGDGAPTEWEFRVSPNGHHFASYDPARGNWLIHTSLTGDVTAEADLTEMDRNTADWARYVEELEDE